MRAKCNHMNLAFSDNAVKCSKNPDFCVYEEQVCDGIANCPDAEDENIAECRHGFHTLATVECAKADIFNVNITTRAVPCNGVMECQDGSDEQNCSLPDEYLIYVLIVISILITIFSVIYWRQTIKGFEPINQNQTLTKEDYDTLHGTIALQTRVQQMQSYPNADIINADLIQMELNHHNRILSETVLCIKVST